LILFFLRFVNWNERIRFVEIVGTFDCGSISIVKRLENKTKRFVCLKAGSISGCAVDLSLYPIDTIKTRLQQKQHLNGMKLFSSLYSGVGSVLIGSGPSSALFFLGYNLTKRTIHFESQWKTHMIAATLGEFVFI